MRGREAHAFIAAGTLWDVVTNTPTQGVVVGNEALAAAQFRGYDSNPIRLITFTSCMSHRHRPLRF